ncbi:hypothetical protein [Phyllobacterium salinisoli]|uniref:hypothetical protein n=1 Tax=Phyllobacterium salinisoli TaxID=1899321 RepID=UPI0011C02884|nr:hypothetical protein [Phyllobacterium salinisoli]
MGYRLTSKYGVPHANIAFLLGMKEKNYLTRLRQLGINPNGDAARLPGMEEILANIRAELMRLTEGGKVPDKGAIDALVSLARALKAVIDLERESTARPVTDADPVPVKPEELREALARIDRRINELADLRAAEIIRRWPERQNERPFEGRTGDSADQGVVSPGA